MTRLSSAPCADDARVGLRAEEEADGAHEEGLARARLAGEEVEAPREAHREPLDQREVADREFLKHRTPAGPPDQASFERRSS